MSSTGSFDGQSLVVGGFRNPSHPMIDVAARGHRSGIGPGGDESFESSGCVAEREREF